MPVLNTKKWRVILFPQIVWRNTFLSATRECCRTVHTAACSRICGGRAAPAVSSRRLSVAGVPKVLAVFGDLGSPPGDPRSRRRWSNSYAVIFRHARATAGQRSSPRLTSASSNLRARVMTIPSTEGPTGGPLGTIVHNDLPHATCVHTSATSSPCVHICGRDGLCPHTSSLPSTRAPDT